MLFFVNYLLLFLLLENWSVMETLGNRIRELRNNLSITQADIATWLNASRQSVSNWETDKADLSGQQLAIIICNTNVNADWLLTGRGKMFMNTNNPTTNNNFNGKDSTNSNSNIYSEKNDGVIQAPININNSNEVEVLKERISLMSEQLEDAKSQIKEKDSQIRALHSLLDKLTK